MLILQFSENLLDLAIPFLQFLIFPVFPLDLLTEIDLIVSQDENLAREEFGGVSKFVKFGVISLQFLEVVNHSISSSHSVHLDLELK